MTTGIVARVSSGDPRNTRHIYYCAACGRYTWAKKPDRTTCRECSRKTARSQPQCPLTLDELIYEIDFLASWGTPADEIATRLHTTPTALATRFRRAGMPDLARTFSAAETRARRAHNA